jgi:hypothetical protein
MPHRIRLGPYLTDDALHNRSRRTHDPVERSHWHFLWLLAGGMTPTAAAAVTGYSAYWIDRSPGAITSTALTACATGAIPRVQGVHDLPGAHQAELGAAVAGPHPEGNHWCGRSVAQVTLTPQGVQRK